MELFVLYWACGRSRNNISAKMFIRQNEGEFIFQLHNNLQYKIKKKTICGTNYDIYGKSKDIPVTGHGGP
jgi:hypothetical protein